MRTLLVTAVWVNVAITGVIAPFQWNTKKQTIVWDGKNEESSSEPGDMWIYRYSRGGSR